MWPLKEGTDWSHDCIKPKVGVAHGTFPWRISLCKRSKTLIDFFPEMLMIQESCNLIRREHFGIELVNQSFLRCTVFSENYSTIIIFILYLDVRTINIPKPSFLADFWPFLVILAQTVFLPKNLTLSRTTPHRPLSPCCSLPKSNGTCLRKLSNM